MCKILCAEGIKENSLNCPKNVLNSEKEREKRRDARFCCNTSTDERVRERVCVCV